MFRAQMRPIPHCREDALLADCSAIYWMYLTRRTGTIPMLKLWQTKDEIEYIRYHSLIKCDNRRSCLMQQLIGRRCAYGNCSTLTILIGTHSMQQQHTQIQRCKLEIHNEFIRCWRPLRFRILVSKLSIKFPFRCAHTLFFPQSIIVFGDVIFFFSRCLTFRSIVSTESHIYLFSPARICVRVCVSYVRFWWGACIRS